MRVIANFMGNCVNAGDNYNKNTIKFLLTANLCPNQTITKMTEISVY